MSLEFAELYKQVHDYTLLTPDRCWHLWRLARECKPILGEMAECGTYKGGSAKLIYKAIHGGKKLYVFDTFEGIPASQWREGEHTPGDFAADERQVRNYLREHRNIRVRKGLVPNVLYEYVKKELFNFVYLDMDLYEPTLAALEFFWPRLSLGGMVVLDDVDHIPGVYQAAFEFRQKYEPKLYSSNPNDYSIEYYKTTIDQAVMVKKQEIIKCEF